MAFTTIQGSGSAPDSFLGSAGVDVIALQNQSDATFLSAREADDTVTFTSFTGLVSNYSLYGGQGSDTLQAQGGTNLSNSFVSFDDGNDTITLNSVTSATIQGNAGNDVVTTNGAIVSALVNGNQGNDTLNTAAGAAGGSIFGGAGFDQITLTGNFSSGSRVQANTDDDAIVIAAGAVINGSTINGNEGNDNIIVGAITTFATSSIYGGTGNDTINAGGSATGITFVSNAGNDNATGSTGADTFFNDSGNDTIAGGNGNDTYTLTSGNNSVTTGAGNDNVSTSTGNDNINGVDGGNLTIADAGGTNTITSGAGTDTISGGVGRDTITANQAADNITGGASADLFVQTANGSRESNPVVGSAFNFTNGVDLVTDFSALQGDVLQGPAALAGGFGIITAVPVQFGVYLFQGTYTGTTFTVNNTGADLLYGTFDTINNNRMADDSIVLQGGFANFTAANIA